MLETFLSNLDTKRSLLVRQIRGIDAARAAYIKEMKAISAEERARFKANAKIAKVAEKAHWEIDKAEMAKTRRKRHMTAATKQKLSLSAKARWAKVKKG